MQIIIGPSQHSQAELADMHPQPPCGWVHALQAFSGPTRRW